MTSFSVIDGWIQSTVERSFQATSLKRLYDLQAAFLFNQYEPVKASADESAISFVRRLDRWLSCFDDPEDQWSAFTALRYFFFIGQQETEEMYRCAVQDKLLPWVTDLERLDIFAAEFDSRLTAEIKQCWICPATDSLRINSLLHCTGLEGKALRPDWLSLEVLGSKERIATYVEKEGIKYLVLFEDFVGGGSQSSKAVKYALSVFTGSVLLVPLVICQAGHEVLKRLEDEYGGRLSYRPVVVIGADCLVGRTPVEGEPSSFATLRTAMERGYRKIGLKLRGKAYGYASVGSLASSYSNCPNNSPPIFHATSYTWPHPIFPRKRRA